jgi:two-component sensor histidine kinase/CHASE3 domain sensor protein
MAIFAAGATYLVRNAIIDAFANLRETRDIETKVGDVITNVLDAETGYRGYLVTRREDVLEPFRKADTAVPARRAELAALVAEEPVLQTLVARYSDAAKAAMDEIRAGVREHEAGTVPREAEVARMLAVKERMDGVRMIHQEFRQVLLGQLLERRNAIQMLIAALLGTIWVLLIGIALAAFTQARELVSFSGRAMREKDASTAEIASLSLDLSQSRAEIQMLYQRLAIALRTAHVKVFTIDRSGMINWASELSIGLLAGRTLPYPLAELAANDRDACRAQIERIFETGELTDFEMKVRGTGLESRWVKITIAPSEGAGGAMSLGTAIDITDLKLREERNVLLMRELSHRSKNLLAIVQAMTRQTARTTSTPAEFHRRFSARLRALAAGHDLLVKASYTGADLVELIRSQLGPLESLIGSRIMVEGPELRLRPEAAQNLGMALHELATNAHIHGSLSSHSGKVDIRWSVEGEGPDGKLVMDWRESGGPPVVLGDRIGFGTTLIAANLPRSLLGLVTLEHPTEGTTCHIELPLSMILEDSEADIEPVIDPRETVETPFSSPPGA